MVSCCVWAFRNLNTLINVYHAFLLGSESVDIVRVQVRINEWLVRILLLLLLVHLRFQLLSVYLSLCLPFQVSLKEFIRLLRRHLSLFHIIGFVADVANIGTECAIFCDFPLLPQLLFHVSLLILFFHFFRSIVVQATVWWFWCFVLLFLLIICEQAVDLPRSTVAAARLAGDERSFAGAGPDPCVLTSLLLILMFSRLLWVETVQLFEQHLLARRHRISVALRGAILWKLLRFSNLMSNSLRLQEAAWSLCRMFAYLLLLQEFNRDVVDLVPQVVQNL